MIVTHAVLMIIYGYVTVYDIYESCYFKIKNYDLNDRCYYGESHDTFDPGGTCTVSFILLQKTMQKTRRILQCLKLLIGGLLQSRKLLVLCRKHI